MLALLLQVAHDDVEHLGVDRTASWLKPLNKGITARLPHVQETVSPHLLKAQGDHKEKRKDQGDDVWRCLQQAGSSRACHLMHKQTWGYAGFYPP
jgi:hypothetical protein